MPRDGGYRPRLLNLLAVCFCGCVAYLAGGKPDDRFSLRARLGGAAYQLEERWRNRRSRCEERWKSESGREPSLQTLAVPAWTVGHDSSEPELDAPRRTRLRASNAEGGEVDSFCIAVCIGWRSVAMAKRRYGRRTIHPEFPLTHGVGEQPDATRCSAGGQDASLGVCEHSEAQ